jgi:ATP-binding cassette subfamily B protein
MSREELQEEDFKNRIDPHLWRRILTHARPYRGWLAAMGILGVLMAAGDVMLPRVTGLLIDEAMHGEGSRAVRLRVVQVLLLVTGMAILVWGFIVVAGRIATGVAYDMRRRAFAHLQELSFSFYDKKPVGWLMARLTSDCERLAGLMPWFMLDLFWGASLVLGITAMMLHLDGRLALCILATMPALAVISVFFQKRLLRTQREVRKINSQMTAAFNEAIMGVRTSKTLVREEENLGEFRTLADGMYANSVRNALLNAIYLPIVLAAGSAGTGLALWQGGLRLGDVSLGTLVAFMQYAAIFYIPVQELAARFTQVQVAQASAERLQGLLDTPVEIADHTDTQDGRLEDGLHEVEFRDVSFSYGGGKEVLSGFNLRVGAGETIALVGSTGGGKTTIVSLLCRFYEPTAGSIRINGIDYRRLKLRRLHERLGVVLQQPHLFSGTIRENIRYGRLTATNGEVEDAARLVGAGGFIAGMEKHYDTEVGEGGNRLSTGQKQLVSLARAVLADPAILILDEATSSVDTESERLIQRGVETLLGGRISFVIAHRLSTVRSADRILVIEGGRLVEQGSHDALMRTGGRYQALYRNQFARAEEVQAVEELLAGE